MARVPGSRFAGRDRPTRPRRSQTERGFRAGAGSLSELLQRLAGSPRARLSRAQHVKRSPGSRDWVFPPRDSVRPAPPSAMGISGPKMIRCIDLHPEVIDLRDVAAMFGLCSLRRLRIQWESNPHRKVIGGPSARADDPPRDLQVPPIASGWGRRSSVEASSGISTYVSGAGRSSHSHGTTK